MTGSKPVAFITGASSGIGASLAMALAVKGYRVALFSRNIDRLIDRQKEIQAKGGEAMVLPGDVTILPQIEEKLKVDFTKMGLPEFCEVMPTFIVHDLNLAKEIRLAASQLLKNKPSHSS